jgi:hypothetical protein
MNPSLESLEKFESNQKWLHEHYDEVLQKHRDRFVAVWHGMVIESDEDLRALKERVFKKIADDNSVYIDYVTDHPLEMIL